MNDFTFAEGDLVIFKGYPEGSTDAPIFEEGQTVKIVSTVEAGSDDKGAYEKYEAIDPDDPTKGDTVFFPDDVEVYAELGEGTDNTEETATGTETPQDEPSSDQEDKPAEPVTEEKPKTKSKSKTKSKTKPKPKTETKPKTTGKETADKTVKDGASTAKAKEAAIPQRLETGEPPLVLTTTVSSLVQDHSALAAAKDLQATVERSYFNLGGVLAHIQETGAFKEANYSDFTAYVEAELGMHKSKAYQLMRIYRKFSSLGADEARFSEIGWTYARAMLGAVTSENFETLISQAKTMSRDDFEAAIKTSYVSDQDPNAATGTRIKKVKFSFALHGDQAENAQKVLDDLKQTHGTEDLNSVFDQLCTFYLQHSEMETSLDEDIEYVENKHKVELQQVPTSE